MSNELNNKSLSIFLISDQVRAVRTQYDPDIEKFRIAKTFDQRIKKDDLVVVQTGQRHKMTVTKVVEVDVEVDFDSSDTCRWIVCPVDRAKFDLLLEQETQALADIKKAQMLRRRRELAADMMAGAEKTIAKLPIANGIDADFAEVEEPPEGGPKTE